MTISSDFSKQRNSNENLQNSLKLENSIFNGKFNENKSTLIVCFIFVTKCFFFLLIINSLIFLLIFFSNFIISTFVVSQKKNENRISKQNTH